MRVWSTKYALTTGVVVREVSAHLIEGEAPKRTWFDGWSNHHEGKTLHFDEASACRAVVKMASTKQAALSRQSRKLEQIERDAVEGRLPLAKDGTDEGDDSRKPERSE